MQSLLLAVIVAFAAWALTGAYLRAMIFHGRFEAPSARGMHAVPVVTGAGCAMMLVAFTAWPIASGSKFGDQHTLLLGAAIFLAIVSSIDDHMGGLSIALRILSQGFAVALLLSLGTDARMFASVPLIAERLLLCLVWLWFINLFNFMDGIDGLAGTETIFVAIGYVSLVAPHSSGDPLPTLGIIIAAAAAGYLFWNWHPARVMMGDAGSIPLGLLLGGLMIDLALRGYWAAAIILPLYFLVDATVTLSTRMVRGEKPWTPHREHFYQRAVLGGNSPSLVVTRVSVANFALMLLALVSYQNAALALSGAVAVVSLLMLHLRHLARRSSRI